MAFVKVPGLPGRLYVPDTGAGKLKKYPCRDCFSCEFCSDDRCRVCRRGDEYCLPGAGCGIGSGNTNK